MPPTASIYFNANEGVFPDNSVLYEAESSNLTIGEELALSNMIPTRQGYELAGWSLTSTGAVEYTMDNLITDVLNYTLYAVWEKATPIITFNSTIGAFQSDSTTSKSVQTNLDGTVSLSTLVEFPIKQSYVLKGWATTENGSVVYTPYATPSITEDTTLYAVWEEAESYLVQEDTLVNIANAVRANTNTSASITLNEMATKVMSIKPFETSISSVTITNNLSVPLEFHSYNSSGGFVKTTIAASSVETHNLHNGVLVFSLPSTAKITTSGATTDLTNTSLAAGAYCIGFTGTLSLSISA